MLRSLCELCVRLLEISDVNQMWSIIWSLRNNWDVKVLLFVAPYEIIISFIYCIKRESVFSMFQLMLKTHTNPQTRLRTWLKYRVGKACHSWEENLEDVHTSSWTCLHTHTQTRVKKHMVLGKIARTRLYLFWCEVGMSDAFHDYMIEITSTAYLWNSWCGSIKPVNIPPTAERRSMFHYLRDVDRARFVTGSFKGKRLKHSLDLLFHVSRISFCGPVCVFLFMLPWINDSFCLLLSAQVKAVLWLYCPQGRPKIRKLCWKNKPKHLLRIRNTFILFEN